MKKIFDYQRSLMDKLAPVERELGYTPPSIPLVLDDRKDQDWFRLMSWYLVEEITEAMSAQPHELGEELADCLHFAVELCILANIPHDCADIPKQLNLLDPIPPKPSLFGVIWHLGCAVNTLKAKHWKKNPQPVDYPRFRCSLSNMLNELVNVIKLYGYTPDQIYFAKHQINEKRIQNNY